jgi:hypothetical protein
VLDGVYRTTEGMPVFHPVRAPTAAELQALLTRIIKRLMRLLVRVDEDVTTPHLSFRTVHASFQRTRLLVDIWAFTPMGPVMHLRAGPVNYLKVLPPVIRVIPVHMMNMNFIGDF